MQGDPPDPGRPALVVLAAAHVLTASVVVLVLAVVGGAVGAAVPVGPRWTALGAFGVAAAAVDLRALARGTPTWGLARQTPKALAHDPNRPWWVTPLVWGADTGLLWTTFRTSSATWCLLGAAVLGLAPWWAGAVDGLAFAVPLVLVRGRARASRRRRVTRLVQGVGMGLLVAPAVLGLAGCAGSERAASASCDDRVRAVPVPAATAARMAPFGVAGAVGQGDVWWVAPSAGRWSALLDAGGRRAKVALWLDRGGALPPIEVHDLGGDRRGTAWSTPTASGVPGPVPTTLELPGPGCWEVVARGRTGTARLRLEAP